MDQIGHYEIWRNNDKVRTLKNKSQARGFVKACIMIEVNIEEYTIFYVIDNKMVDVTDNIIKDVITKP